MTDQQIPPQGRPGERSSGLGSPIANPVDSGIVPPDCGSKSPAPAWMPGKIVAQRERRIAETMPMYRGIMRRAIYGKASPREAIKAFCLHCVGDLRDQITNCTAVACPLFEYRPYQQPGKGEDE